jgi:hypothetical protein
MSTAPVLAACAGLAVVAGRLLSDGTPRELDDDVVRPGWLGFAVFLALVVAAYFLFRSMRKHLKKVDFVEEPPEGAPPGPEDPPRP